MWLTQNIYHILLPLLQLTFYKSPFLNASKIWTIRHFFIKSSEIFSWTFDTAPQNKILLNSLATICDDRFWTSWFICNTVDYRIHIEKKLWLFLITVMIVFFEILKSLMNFCSLVLNENAFSFFNFSSTDYYFIASGCSARKSALTETKTFGEPKIVKLWSDENPTIFFLFNEGKKSLFNNVFYWLVWATTKKKLYSLPAM